MEEEINKQELQQNLQSDLLQNLEQPEPQQNMMQTDLPQSILQAEVQQNIQQSNLEQDIQQPEMQQNVQQQQISENVQQVVEQQNTTSNINKIIKQNLLTKSMIEQQKQEIGDINIQILSNSQVCDIKNKIFDIIEGPQLFSSTIEQQQSQIQQNSCIISQCEITAQFIQQKHILQIAISGKYNNNTMKLLIYQDDCLQQQTQLSKKAKQAIQSYRKAILKTKSQLISEDLSHFTFSKQTSEKSGKKSTQQAWKEIQDTIEEMNNIYNGSMAMVKESRKKEELILQNKLAEVADPQQKQNVEAQADGQKQQEVANQSESNQNKSKKSLKRSAQRAQIQENFKQQNGTAQSEINLKIEQQNPQVQEEVIDENSKQGQQQVKQQQQYQQQQQQQQKSKTPATKEPTNKQNKFDQKQEEKLKRIANSLSKTEFSFYLMNKKQYSKNSDNEKNNSEIILKSFYPSDEQEPMKKKCYNKNVVLSVWHLYKNSIV